MRQGHGRPVREKSSRRSGNEPASGRKAPRVSEGIYQNVLLGLQELLASQSDSSQDPRTKQSQAGKLRGNRAYLDICEAGRRIVAAVGSRY